MTWGNEILAWLASDEGWRVLSGAIIPALAIIVAGIIAALIGRGAVRRLIRQHDRDALTAAVGGFVLAGRRAAQWHELDVIERDRTDHLVAEAETRIRLLPISGAGMAASWAAHELESMKRDSSGFRFQAQQTLAEYRDRLVAWSEKPRSAKKLFGADLERWKYEGDDDVTRNSAAAVSSPEQPAEAWVPTPNELDDAPLTPEPPSSVAAATGTMPLVVTTPMSASTVRERVSPTPEP